MGAPEAMKNSASSFPAGLSALAGNPARGPCKLQPGLNARFFYLQQIGCKPGEPGALSF